MRHGKRELPRQPRSKKSILTLTALILVFCCTVGGTLAFLVTQSTAVKNTFTPSQVTCQVNETLENGTKKDVTIQNTGDTDAYIRAAIVVNWADEAGNVYADAPVADTDYTISYGYDWKKHTDGYWYYKDSIAANGETTSLILSCSKNDGVTPPSGYDLCVEIIADAIQTGPDNTQGAMNKAWGVTINSGGTITAASKA